MRKKLAPVIFVALLLAILVGAARSQTPHPGIVLFKQGNYEGALATLDRASKEKEFKTNAEIFNYLGLSQIKNGDTKRARKSLEKAVSLAPTNLDYRTNLAFAYLLNRQLDKAQSATEAVLRLDPKHVGAHYLHGIANIWEGKIDEAEADANRIIGLDPLYCDAYILKSDVQIARLGAKTAKGAEVRQEIGYLKSAVEILERGISVCAKGGNVQPIESKYESAKAFHAYFAKEKSPVTAGAAAIPEPGVVPLKILSKPKPGYTDSARSNNKQGTIVLAILFGANGRIEGTLLLNRLGYGLDEQAMSAARRMKFEPKTVNGKPVPVVKMVEYSFAIY